MRVPVGVGAIFVVTFLLIFVFFTMVEFNLTCKEDHGDSFIPRCQIITGKGGDFVFGVLLVGLLMMADMALIYKILIDFFV
jgi:hypothetical protein